MIEFSPFFARIDQNYSYALDFFYKEYERVFKDKQQGTYLTMTLTEIIGNNKEDVRNNPHLFHKEFLKGHSELY